ncbi:MAG: hypothetical protein HY399_01710, partial [Elusimicrobia bacterium]|nr:hypothetical protein [Elusimicrobiota bacterium]
RKPNRMAVGVNVIAPVPAGSAGARDIPELKGPGAPMSGTSMSRPVDLGCKSLLTRAILLLLKDYLPTLPPEYLPELTPVEKLMAFALNAAEGALTQSARKDHKEDRDFEIKYGDGFTDVWAAFHLAAAALKGAATPSVTRTAREATRALMGHGRYGDMLTPHLQFTAEGVRLAAPVQVLMKYASLQRDYRFLMEERRKASDGRKSEYAEFLSSHPNYLAQKDKVDMYNYISVQFLMVRERLREIEAQYPRVLDVQGIEGLTVWGK